MLPLEGIALHLTPWLTVRALILCGALVVAIVALVRLLRRRD